jgi:pyruvate,water dikinase
MIVRRLNEVGLADTAIAGGKGASLGELSRLGVGVPPGFVVTTAAYHDPAALPEHVFAAYRELGGGPVAVRSSATSEDSAAASFAGVWDTFLCVQGAQAVLAGVRRCWASLENAESVAYRRHHGITDLAMAVVVQRMVDARCAGVMFTRSPLTGDRSVVAVEGSWGLGSALVGGEVTPDRFVVNKVTGEVIQRTVASKQRWHRPHGDGVMTEAVPDELRDVCCLTDGELAELLAVARRIEDHYGAPQDIEWAFGPGGGSGGSGGSVGSGGLAILQSRPETVWARRDGAPIATPKARPFDHVFDLLGQRHADR